MSRFQPGQIQKPNWAGLRRYCWRSSTRSKPICFVCVAVVYYQIKHNVQRASCSVCIFRVQGEGLRVEGLRQFTRGKVLTSLPLPLLIVFTVPRDFRTGPRA